MIGTSRPAQKIYPERPHFNALSLINLLSIYGSFFFLTVCVLLSLYSCYYFDSIGDTGLVNGQYRTVGILNSVFYVVFWILGKKPIFKNLLFLFFLFLNK